MKKKNIISLSVAFAFLALSSTGILLYVKQKAHAVEITHTIFGLVFVCFAVFHIINNWSSITGYSKERKSGKYQKEFMIASFGFLLLLAGGATEFLEPVAEAGKIFAKKKEKIEQVNFTVLKTNNDIEGKPIELLVEKTDKVEFPTITVWTEDSAHNFVENLFVPTKTATKLKDGEENLDINDFKPESLSTWYSKATTKAPNFLKETPNDNFILKSKVVTKGSFYIMLEINSGDDSEVYTAFITNGKTKVFGLNSDENNLLKKAIVTL